MPESRLSRLRPAARLIVLSALLPVVPATAAVAGTVDREYSESFDVSPGATLRLFHDDGDATITPWSEDRLEVVVRYHVVSRGIGGPRDFEVDFDRSGDTITVEGREIGSNLSFGSSRTHEYTYAVKAPSYVTLELSGDDGDVAVRGWEAPIDIDIEDGDVRIDGLDGDLSVKSDDGDLELSDIRAGSATVMLQDGDVFLRGGSGEWRLTLDDGDFDATGLEATALDIETSDGDVDIELAPTARLEASVRTSDGDVTIVLPPSAALEFEIEVDDGRVSLPDSGAIVGSRSGDRTLGRVGDGSGGRLDIRTRDGNVTLRDQ